MRAQRRQAVNVLSGEWPATEHIDAWRTTAGHLGHDVGLGDCSLRICTVVYRPPRSQLVDCLGVYSSRGAGERRGLVRCDSAADYHVWGVKRCVSRMGLAEKVHLHVWFVVSKSGTQKRPQRASQTLNCGTLRTGDDDLSMMEDRSRFRGVRRSRFCVSRMLATNRTCR